MMCGWESMPGPVTQGRAWASGPAATETRPSRRGEDAVALPEMHARRNVVIVESPMPAAYRPAISKILPALLSLALSACVAWGAGEPESGTNLPPAAPGLPLWEAGVFGMVGRLPLYRGADEYKTYVLPLPYAIYRGEVLQADREGVRGLFYRGPRLETDLSMNGNPPVDDGSKARRDMPELEPLIEVGPAVKFHLYRGMRYPRLHVEAAARAVVSVDRSDLGSRYEGKRVTLGLVLADVRHKPWIMGMRAGVDFADAGYNAYFYDVSEAETLPDRAPYRSKGGYGGCSLSAFLVRTLTPDLSVSLYGRWDNVDGAVYEDSPLVKRENNAVIGLAASWRIAASSRYVTRR